MSLKITNDAQAQKWSAWVKATEEIGGAETKSIGLNLPNGTYGTLGYVKSALAAYEAERELDGIVLTPCEEARLVYISFADNETDQAQKSLERKGLESTKDEAPTYRGRAYLARRKPTREMKWEVHRVGVEDSFRLATDCKDMAEELMGYLEKVNNKTYEVSEVKA